MSTVDEVAVIRRLLKQQAPTLSIRRGRGTSSGWVDIWGSGYGGGFTAHERQVLDAVGLQPGGNFAGIAPDARAFWIKKLGGLAEAERLPRCIVCGDEAVIDFVCNCDLVHWLCEAHRDIPRKDCAFIRYERRALRVVD